MESLASFPTPPPEFRSGFVALVGRPNVGKSTLFNRLLGQKVAITSPVAQTTRNRLRGILTTPTAQFIFVDTPGIHKPHHRLGEVLVQNAKGILNRVDAVVCVVDGTALPGTGDRYVAQLLTTAKSSVLMVVNKIDQVSAKDRAARLQAYQALGGWPVYGCSAMTGEGVERLQGAIAHLLPLGPYYYPPEMVTDQPERFIMAELIREQILHHTREEVPIPSQSPSSTCSSRATSPGLMRPFMSSVLAKKPFSLAKGGNDSSKWEPLPGRKLKPSLVATST
nr:GTPase Era [Thermostichus lividus]